jgi:hypothetical protein
MVSRTSRGRRSSAKQRYTKRRVHRNKRIRNTYRMKRGGAFGKKKDCLAICDQIKDNDKKNVCLSACDAAFGAGEKDGSEISNNFPDLRNYN